MNDVFPAPQTGEDRNQGGQTITPLPGEAGIPDVAARTRFTVSKKGIFAVALLVVSLIAVSTVSIQRFAAGNKRPDNGESKRPTDRPAAATTEPRRLDLTQAPAASAVTRIPALVPTPQELAEPIGVRRSGQIPVNPKSMPPEDAPAVLVSSRPAKSHSTGLVKTGRGGAPTDSAATVDAASSADSLEETRRNLEGYQRQLQGTLDTLSRTAAAAGGQPSPAPSVAPSSMTALLPSRSTGLAPPHRDHSSAGSCKARRPRAWLQRCSVTAA